jgi:hypothetical protein
MKPWMFSQVGCSLACGFLDPSEANLNLWIKPTLLLRSGSFAAVFPWVAEAWWHVWASWAGAAGPGGLAGPGGVADPASWLLCCSPVVCLLDPAWSWWVLSFGSWCIGLHLVWTCIVVQDRAGYTTRCGRAYLMWLGAPELPPNLDPIDKNSTQLVEPC